MSKLLYGLMGLLLALIPSAVLSIFLSDVWPLVVFGGIIGTVVCGALCVLCLFKAFDL